MIIAEATSFFTSLPRKMKTHIGCKPITIINQCFLAESDDSFPPRNAKSPIQQKQQQTKAQIPVQILKKEKTPSRNFTVSINPSNGKMEINLCPDIFKI